MKTNNMNINSMKNYSKYICLFLMLVGMSVSAWGAKTGTIEFGNSPKVAINSASVTGNDTQGNTWKIVTVGTTSYTSNASYYQVGSSSKPATSITFGVKLSHVVSISAFSAKFGGFSDTEGSIALKVTNKSTSTTSSVGTGSLSGASDVTIENSTTATGDSLTVTVTSISKGVKCYYVSYTYVNTAPYTVAFSAVKGTSAKSSLTEGSASAGVTLPDVDVDDDVEAAGWGFYGWSTSSCDDETTTTHPIVGKAGDTYYPDASVTLYAVYAKGEFTKVTSTDGITSGAKYLILGDDYNEARKNVWQMGTNYYSSSGSYWMGGHLLGNGDSRIKDSYHAADVYPGSYLITGSAANYVIKDESNTHFIDVYVTNWLAASSSRKNTITFGSGGHCTIKNNSGSKYLDVFTTGEFSDNGSAWDGMMLYKETTTAKYNSNPCGNIVSLSAGTETHATITSFSETGVETCSSTDADRQVTVSVTADTGYELTSSARLTFAKSSGSATATYVSGPTGSGPNYTFVYQFTKDDKGAGTFSVTATAKQCAITFDKNDGEGGSDGTTATYDAAMPDITPPTRTGYTFDGYWDAETDNNGSGNQYYKADGTSKKNWDKNTTSATTLYAKWNINSYTLAIASVDHVTISSTSPSVAAGSSTSVNYGTTVTLSHGTPSDGRTWSGWNAYKTGDTGTPVAVNGSNQFTMPAYDVTVSANLYGDFVFSCSELTLTPKLVTASTPIFITSAASKKVRSQDKIQIEGTGLTPNITLTFALSDPSLASKFAIKKADGTALATDASGAITADAYIFYTPDAEDETDGLDKLEWITASVSGAKPITKKLTQSIIGRHLPADFVIAAKKDGKWWAMPANMSELSTPSRVEIAVNNIDNPSVAYTATTNIYNLYGQNTGGSGYLYNDGDSDGNPDGEKIKLGMKNNSNKPLFASTTGKATIKGDGTATVTNNIGKQYWWILTQTNTSITNPQDATYKIYNTNNEQSLTLEDAGTWGMYATDGTDVDELRLIPASASSVVPTEAEIVAWGKNEAIIEVDQPTIGATSVIGKLPGDASSKITLSQTGTSKGTGTRYDYTVDFGDDVDFSANEGKMLMLEWYNALDQLVAVSNVTVPRIVASNTTLNSSNFTNKSVWNTEVHVLPGNTLTIDASAYDGSNVTIKELNIYPGATVTVTGGTLIPTTLVLRNGWSRIGEKKYDIARLHIASTGSVGSTTAYADWYIDYDQYYPIAVPWQVATSAITYKNMTVAIDQGLIIRRYDGERHAKGGKDGDGNTNWKQYTWGGTMPANLEPGIGYAITARRPAGKAFSIIRMPLTIPSVAWTINGEQGEVSSVHKDQVAVTAWVKDEGETPDHAKGWNFIANPYMCMYEGEITHSVDDDYNIAYVNIPDVNFKEFDQVEISDAKLKPGSGFLIQTEETGTLTFGTSNRKASAPSYRTATPKATKQKAYIILSGEEAEDKMGLIISERYTAEYEINADLEKLLSDGNTLRTFMRYGNLNMAYVAINEELAREWIPVTVRIPAAGEYTFSLHEASKISELEGIYLIDYESNTITNLIENNYSFVAAGGTVEGRFAINAIAGQHETPTDIDIINAGGDIHSDKPVKFLYHDKVFIYHRGVIYDATGKKVREINK